MVLQPLRSYKSMRTHFTHSFCVFVLLAPLKEFIYTQFYSLREPEPERERESEMGRCVCYDLLRQNLCSAPPVTSYTLLQPCRVCTHRARGRSIKPNKSDSHVIWFVFLSCFFSSLCVMESYDNRCKSNLKPVEKH